MQESMFRGRALRVLAAVTVGLAAAATASAQEARFSNADGSIEIVGTVKAFDGKTYVIESLFGTLDISSDAVSCEGDGCPIRKVARSWSEGEIGAQVTLASADGTMNLTGELVTFDGEVIQIENSIGLLELPFEDIRCTGSGCPEAIEKVTYIIPGS